MRHQFNTPFEYDKWLDGEVEKSDVVVIWVGFSQYFNSAAQKTWSATFRYKGTGKNFSARLYDDKSKELASTVGEYTLPDFRYVPSDRASELCDIALRCLRDRVPGGYGAIGEEPITFVICNNNWNDVEQVPPASMQT